MLMILASAHRCGEESVNEECPFCRSDITLCQGTEPEKAEESTKAATESVPEPEDPLTPDGNMNLVDDYGDHEAPGKQFGRTGATRAGTGGDKVKGEEDTIGSGWNAGTACFDRLCCHWCLRV